MAVGPATRRRRGDRRHPARAAWSGAGPIVMLVEAEAMAAAGDPDRANGLMERVIKAVGVDEAWRLRGGVPSRLPWPMPASMRPAPRRPSTPAFGGSATTAAPTPPSPERTAAAHARLEAARRRLQRGTRRRGRPGAGGSPCGSTRAMAGEGVALAEPTLGPQPPPERLLLYGDLLRAAGRERGGRRRPTTAPPAPGLIP